MSHTLDIGTVSHETGVSAHTLRYYESAGLMIPVPRDPAGRRQYTNAHIRWVRFLRRLRDAGMGIAQIRRYAMLTWSNEDPAGEERRSILLHHRADVQTTIDRLTEHAQMLDRKIAHGCVPQHTQPPKCHS